MYHVFFRNLYIFSWFSIALPQHHGKQDMSLVASPFVFMSLDGLGSECGQTKEKTIEWHLKLKLKQIWLGEIKWICHGTWKCDTQDVWYCFTTQFLDPKPTIPLLAELLQVCLAENNTAAVHPFTVKNKCLLRIGIQGAVCGKKKNDKKWWSDPSDPCPSMMFSKNGDPKVGEVGNFDSENSNLLRFSEASSRN